MSAFVVSKTHIDVVVSGASDVLPSLAYRHGTPDLIGQILWRANVRSVLHRYPRIVATDEAQVYADAVAAYRHTRYLAITPGQLAKALDCLDYQSCETDDWRSTPAHEIVETIRGAILQGLPGYEAAPWGIERSHIVRGALATGGR